MGYTQDQLRILKKEFPEIRVRNLSVTTSSIYLKTPDGFSLRIGDHNGKQKYKYKWNLLKGETIPVWRREGAYTRFYTEDVYILINEIKRNMPVSVDKDENSPKRNMEYYEDEDDTIPF